MPYFMDRHDLNGATAADIAAAHLKDVETQKRHDVDFVTYWFDYERQHAFCFARAPSREAVISVHREAHGELPSQVIDVDERDLARFMGGLASHPLGDAYVDSAFRAILFTDLEGSTDLTARLGDVGAMEVLRRHDAIVREALSGTGGTEVKHTGDGIMASFRSVSGAIECAVAIQQVLSAAEARAEMPVGVRIGIAAGEPVAEGKDLFGTPVQLAARLCARAAPRTILVPTAVRELAQGKNFRFATGGTLRLKGFSQPVRTALVEWREQPAFGRES
ncbi:MAG TPA: nickel-binding protein [Candidatus Limnocylindrales bacterium]|nr:nickel-binding protein [Candidatus Limnocylindrales bacterium]